MKSVFTRLSALFLIGSVAMVGCTDFSEDLRVLNDKIENLASTTAQEVKRLDDAIASLAAKIAEQYATKQEVELVQNAVDQVKADLKTAKEDVQKALDLKADKSALEAAVNNVTTELGKVAEQLSQLVIKDQALESSIGDLNNQITSINGQLTTITETLAGKANQSDLDALDQKIEGQLTDLNTQLTNLVNGKLDDLQKELDNYKKGIATEFETVKGSITTLETTLTQKIEALEDRATQDQLNQLKKDLLDADAAIIALLNAKADQTSVNNAIKEVNAAITNLTDKVNAWVDNDTIYDDTELRNMINSAKNEYQSIETSLVARIEALESSIVALRSELRGAVFVPETLYNGTKAVLFKRIEGENVLKTFANVSYHFNPSNFDVTKATYEIVATPVEFRPLTPSEEAEYGDGPAIEIVGQPVQENGKVTFKLERAEGAGNMFALKATLENGAVIYSDYALVLDEANYCIATATSSFQVERLAFNFPSLTSISAIIEYVQSLGQTIEDFESTIKAIQAAIEAMQNNDISSAIENLITIPGLRKETMTINGVGVYKVQVETLDAEEIILALKNAQSIDEIRNIINDLLGKANGLGEAGSAIIDGLNNVVGGSGLNELFGQYDNLLDFELPNLVLTYEQAVATLDQYQVELNKAKEEFNVLKDEMNAIVAGLDEATQAEIAALQAELDALNAQYADLQAQYNAATSLGDQIKIGAQMTSVWGQIEAKELSITAKAGTEYFLVKAEYDLKEAGVKTAELLLKGAREAVDLADAAVKNAEETIAKLENEILNKVKDYIFENTELGQYLKELENALGEQAWEAKKTAAAGTAQFFALDALVADLIKNYNAANEQVVDEFANSLFGRVAYLIQTQEAADAFELIGLTDLYTVLKQLPDLLTLIIKYYPAGVDLSNFTSFNDFGTIFSDYLTGLVPEMEVTWDVDYLPAK